MKTDEVRTALAVLDLRERLIFRMAVFDGMRPGEIFAVQIGKVGSHSVVIDQRLYGSTDIDTPKGRKGKKYIANCCPFARQRAGPEPMEGVPWRLSGFRLPLLFGDRQHSSPAKQSLEEENSSEARASRA